MKEINLKISGLVGEKGIHASFMPPNGAVFFRGNKMNTTGGYCECGCGGLAPISKMNSTARGYLKGKPRRFIQNHGARFKPKGKDSHTWRGGLAIQRNRVLVYQPDHPNAVKKYVRRNILTAEKALGKLLPKAAVVHHVNGDTFNDKNWNLVLCENTGYHNLLHRRKRAYEACGNANWLKCKHCKEYDVPENLYVYARSGGAEHPKCVNQYHRDRHGTH